ncbi:MAG: DUF4345 family protein [Candidatus Limnocylindrus sp.]
MTTAMMVSHWSAIAGAVGTLCLGMFGLLAPTHCARFVGLSARDRTGFGEFRATYGGLFIALGALPLWSGEPMAFLAASLAWGGAAVGRLISVLIDGGYQERRSLAAFAFECAFALLLATGV